jgi:hypothetical protein
VREGRGYAFKDIQMAQNRYHASPAIFFGSEQEFVRNRILGRFLENHEFSLGRCHALGLQQQVREILVAAAAA